MDFRDFLEELVPIKKNVPGWLCGTAELAGVEGACFPAAPEQQQSEPTHPPGT